MAGGIPIIRPLRESLVGERITRVMGIVNGTTNYILTRMTEAGAHLRRRPRRGPGARLRRARPHRRRRGLRRRRQGRDHRQHRLRRRGRRRRRLPRGHHRHHRRSTSRSPAGSATSSSCSPSPSRTDAGAIGVRVHPAMVPRRPPAGRGARELQRRVRRGRGGRRPHVLRPRRRRRPHRQRGARRPHRRRRQPAQGLPRLHRHARPGHASAPSTTSSSAYYLNLEVRRPARRAAPQVAGVFGDHGVSIRSMEQEGLGDEARLIFITHRAREADVQATLRDLARARRGRPHRLGRSASSATTS